MKTHLILRRIYYIVSNKKEVIPINDDYNFWISQGSGAPGFCPGGTIGYTVKAGDTLYNIARLYGTTVTAILGANPGINPNRLEIGGRFCVPTTGTGLCSNGLNYTIQPGDTLYHLSIRFKVTVTAIISANPGVNPNRLAVGQVICIPHHAQAVPSPHLKTPCCSILEPTSTHLPPLPDLPALPEGSVLLRQVAASANVYALLFAANGLPAPDAIGDFDAYLGSILIQVEVRSGFLASSAPFEQPKTWAGTLLLPVAPKEGDVLEISPVNTTSGSVGEAVLRGIVD